MSGLSDLERLLAHEEIRQLAAGYAAATDARDLDTLVSLFVDDVRVGRDAHGRDALKAFFTESLRGVVAPTVVIHGSADVMCGPSGGRATADAIPGARFELIDGLGHDLPPGAWPILIDAIVSNARRA